MKPRILVSLLAFVLPLGILTASARSAPDEDQWYALESGGTKLGWVHTSRTRAEDAEGLRWISDLEMDMTIARGGTPLRIVQTSHTEEDEAGQVVSFSQKTEIGAQANVMQGRLADGKLRVTNGTRTDEVAYPEGALGPAAVERLSIAKGFKAGTTYPVDAFEAEAKGFVDHAEVTVGPVETVDVLGREKSLYRTEVKSQLLPGPQVSWVDEAGTPWVMEIPAPMFGTLRMVRTEEAVAKADVEPKELFVKSLIEPKGRIDAPRALRHARYRIVGRGLDRAFPDAVGQKVVAREDGAVVLEVAPPDPARVEGVFDPPYEIEGHGAELQANAWLEVDDPLIQSMSKEAVAGATNAVEAAHAIEAYVAKKITKKDFSTGFGSAADTAHSLAGDCTEHAVLVAALARAAGLPARVVMGLVYLNAPNAPAGVPKKFFGYHMWDEVLVANDTWLPVDAAIGAMDATHLAMGRSDLSSISPLTELILPVMQAMGGLQIEID